MRATYGSRASAPRRLAFGARAVSRVQLKPVAVATLAEPEVVHTNQYDAGLRVEIKRIRGSGWEVDLQAQPARPMMLHWAVNDWEPPPQAIWPADTYAAGDQAVQTRFNKDGYIRLNFKEATCPGKVVFVLKELEPENWINDGGVDFTLHLKPPGIETVAQKIIAAEATYTHWSLFQRQCMALEVLDAADAAGPEGMALVFTWLRLSSLRQLDWYRKSNYQSKDIAHVQKTLAERFTDKARSARDPWNRLLARMTLEGLPRGGGNGDDIRMGILNIMRAHGIKEGHRPGIDEKFLEQWHQKLHTNTTPDDIAVCEAYLAYLHSGNHDDYWRVLWDVGKLSKKDLESWSKPITAWPMHLPHLIDPFKHYLWLLKVTHSGANLDTAAEMAKGHMDEDLRWHLYDLLANRDAWWAPGKIVEVRSRLSQYWKAPGASRDLLLLDIALDSWFRVLVERTDNPDIKRNSALEMVSLILRNALLSSDDDGLTEALHQWEWVKGRVLGVGADPHAEVWGLPRQHVLELTSAVQRVELALAAHMDKLYGLVQPYADQFGAACKTIDKQYIANFGEEVARGRPLFVLSPLLKRLEVDLAATGQIPPWQVISNGPGSVVGVVQCVGSLGDVQGQAFTTPTVLLSEHVAGSEDIPANVVAVITRDPLDVLCHAAIRARAQRVVLACTSLSSQWDALRTLATQAGAAGSEPSASPVTVSVGADGVVSVTQEGELPGGKAGKRGGAKRRVQLPAPRGTHRWVLNDMEFEPGLVGAKALNCGALAAKRGGAIPVKVGVPRSLALPLGTFEKVLADPANAQVAQRLGQLLATVQQRASAATASGGNTTPVLDTLSSVRDLVGSSLRAPPALVTELAYAAATAGMIPAPELWIKGGEAWGAAWEAICTVWASKWNDRAWLNRAALGIPDDQLYMGVLLQQVVPADYAFVLHTAHPVTGEKGHTFGEVVVGMGEALVGNYPGRAMSFSAAPGSPGPHVATLPSKHIGLHACLEPGLEHVPLLIARSDANGEDLSDLAGAGLYDSVPLWPLDELPVKYAAEPLMTDPGFRDSLMQQLIDVGRSVREAFGGEEQDIEGVVSGGTVWVVQSRPQVLH